ncbi:hypothetical protein A1Q1_03073 [Trichosporon asahii var. asahii CBS 2479]|uniref:Uncharacterized protein n=1 Tax=Trichosporon asahii var. asahii (strain ATCC 90039 / CBS 2479 / JCM 2466 / KCTC 7840 / NBRC 103889/ NCYC 2677 / UAMH 7654) TaxID=1186058 RepID=J6F6D8_TRIAS|nr:hypothetical protein A1Q1_03073 [Trichosporon asahii var. asahii CBS 2479]EJT52619.1 hypothetical protein A1Q1_03073 [Trichosporon asahii var. asahii CBS 2479]
MVQDTPTPSPITTLVNELTPVFATNLENAGVSSCKAEETAKAAGEKVKARLTALLKEATSAEKSRILTVSPTVRTQIAGDAKQALFDRMYVLALATWVQAALQVLNGNCECAPLPALYAPDGARLRESPPMKVWNNMCDNIESAYESAKDTVGDWLIAAGEWLKE